MKVIMSDKIPTEKTFRELPIGAVYSHSNPPIEGCLWMKVKLINGIITTVCLYEGHESGTGDECMCFEHDAELVLRGIK
jgi:hypothetical protein